MEAASAFENLYASTRFRAQEDSKAVFTVVKFANRRLLLTGSLVSHRHTTVDLINNCRLLVHVPVLTDRHQAVYNITKRKTTL
jgi:hypothetical protein